MAPQIDPSLKPTVPADQIHEHPLPVWYEDVRTGRGNGIVSRAYNDEMGAICGEDSWEHCVLNSEYWESYERFKARAVIDEIWFHRLIWKNPTTGEIQRKLSRAKWVSDNEIFGEVLEEVETSLPWFGIVLKRIILFALGVMVGYGGATIWPMTP